MQVLSPEQRHSIHRIWLRERERNPALPYRVFRRRVQPTIGCDAAIILPFANMWLCIERDGYTHS